jgi:hypothetical protein
MKDVEEKNSFYCSQCHSIFHYKCLITQIKKDNHCPNCGNFITLWNVQKGIPDSIYQEEKSKENNKKDNKEIKSTLKRDYVINLPKEVRKSDRTFNTSTYQYLCSICHRWIDEDDKDLICCRICDIPLHSTCLENNNYCCPFCNSSTSPVLFNESNRFYRNLQSSMVREVNIQNEDTYQNLFYRGVPMQHNLTQLQLKNLTNSSKTNQQEQNLNTSKKNLDNLIKNPLFILIFLICTIFFYWITIPIIWLLLLINYVIPSLPQEIDNYEKNLRYLLLIFLP